jgi:hypothetical protein
MDDFDPVSWQTREAALGSPAPEIEEYVETMEEDVREKGPYDAVKTIHDALSEDFGEAGRTVAGLGEVFITAYLLEKKGVVTPDSSNTEHSYRSLVERRPDSEQLDELFWEHERTLWWIGILVGVHPSLVSYWLYEDDIPLMERNYTEASMEQIRAYRESENG